MAQSTEEYLDSLLRQAMGVPETEPEAGPEASSDLERDDVLAMADGLTGSHSAILGNAYDHNASFTNQGEIELSSPQTADKTIITEDIPEVAPEVAIPPELAPDPDAPVAATSVDISSFPEDLLPDVGDELPVSEEIPDVITDETASAIEDTADAATVMPDESVTIPEGPVIEPDTGNLDIIPEAGLMPEIEAPAAEMPEVAVPTAEMPEVAVPEIEVPEVEIPVQEPVIEEPAVEEPVIQEPVAEEAPAEETPTLSIDDLDPSDASKALDADTIAALFANANAEEPAAEEPAAEEPAIEEAAEDVPAQEPVIEEPVIEETVIEEPVTEEPVAEEGPAEEAPTLSIDALDPNDASKTLDADQIAALFAGANAEEDAAEEPTSDETEAEETAEETSEEEPAGEEAPESDDASLEGSEDALEELEIPMGDEEPLMADQEISDLLSTLGMISGESAEDETAEGPEEASGEESEGVPSDTGDDIDLGVDMFDTDLSAMLDDVTGSLEGSGEDTAEGAADADLNDLLSSMNDDSGDLSDIGDLLGKDENSELVDPNTETAEALFSSDSQEDLFDIDNLIDEEEGSGGKKKKKKKFSLFGLFGKKKKGDGDGDIEVISDGEEEMLVDPELLDMPEKKEKEKKPGFFANLFAKLFEEVEDEDAAPSGIDQSAVEIAQEGAAENEAILAELEDRSDGKDKKKEKKEKKKKEKKGKKGQEAGGEEGEEGAEEPKKKKKEKKKKEKPAEPEGPVRKLPRKKVVAITLFCLTIGIVITALAFLLPYQQDMNKAKKFYSTGEYQKTYEYMRGHKLTSDDQLLYDRTITLLRIKRPYDSYENYMKMGLRMEALNALVQGVQMSDTYAEEAATLGIIDKYSKLSRQIYDELYNTFGVTVDKARSWIQMEGTPDYTRALYETLADPTASPKEQNTPSQDEEEVDNSVINAEENDL